MIVCAGDSALIARMSPATRPSLSPPCLPWSPTNIDQSRLGKMLSKFTFDYQNKIKTLTVPIELVNIIENDPFYLHILSLS